MSKPASISELIALNDEIAALVRAGVPLELGLGQLADSAPSGLARLSGRLSERMSAGVSLQDALKDEGGHAPDVYVAVVEVGIRANRLPEALESVSALSRSLLELHRKVVLALVYPLIVLVIAYSMFVGFVYYFVWGLNGVYQTLQFEPGFAIRAMIWLRESIQYWGPGIPILGLLLACWVTLRQPSAKNSGSLVPKSIYSFRWIPWIRSAMDQFDNATFARLAALLIQHKAPLHEAVLLAGHATGNPKIRADVDQIATRLQAGQSLESSLEGSRQLPKFMRWMMTLGGQHGALDATLQQASDVYESRAQQEAHWARVTLPIIMTVGVAGVAVLLYGQALFLPVIELYEKLMIPVV
jgi:type II secretory pathway component PulF